MKLKDRSSKVFKRVVIAVISVVIILAVLIGCFAYRNLKYDIIALRKVYNVGYEEKSVTLEDGTILNYAEGPDTGPALLLIHGQTMQWEDYANVLPKLSEYYHVYAVDCHGHGESSKNIDKYTCISMAEDFNWFIENIIKEPCVISGHSSGGILAAWISANKPENVLGVVLEDPPFFSVNPDEMKNTFVWLDGFVIAHNFINQSEVDNYTVYYIENSYFWSLFGKLQSIILDSTKEHFYNYPNKPLKLWYVPYKWLYGTRYLNQFDVMFAETFYTGEWLSGVSQEEILSNITCPSVYIKAETKYGDDGVLYAANTDEDAKKVHELLSHNEMVTIKSGHNIHFEHPDKYIDIMMEVHGNIEQ